MATNAPMAPISIAAMVAQFWQHIEANTQLQNVNRLTTKKFYWPGRRDHGRDERTALSLLDNRQRDGQRLGSAALPDDERPAVVALWHARNHVAHRVSTHLVKHGRPRLLNLD